MEDRYFGFLLTCILLTGFDLLSEYCAMAHKLMQNNPDRWVEAVPYAQSPLGLPPGETGDFRKMRVEHHPTSRLVKPNVPTRSVYAGKNPYDGKDLGASSPYYYNGSLPDVLVRQEVAHGLEAINHDVLKFYGVELCILDGQRTDELQRDAIRRLTADHLGKNGITDINAPIDPAILIPCAIEAGKIWALIGIQADPAYDVVEQHMMRNASLMSTLRDIAAAEYKVAASAVTDPQLKEALHIYIRIVRNTGINAAAYPEVAKTKLIINNAPHMTGAATDTRLMNPDGTLCRVAVPFDHPVPEMSTLLLLETPEGVASYRHEAAIDPRLRLHLQEQGMDPDNISDSEINEMRINQRIHDNVMYLAGAVAYVMGESWHNDWCENPKCPSTGEFAGPLGHFLHTRGIVSGNGPWTADVYGAAADYGNGKGVPAVFGGNQAYEELRRLGLM